MVTSETVVLTLQREMRDGGREGGVKMRGEVLIRPFVFVSCSLILADPNATEIERLTDTQNAYAQR